jgi:hypothetical protein
MAAVTLKRNIPFTADPGVKARLLRTPMFAKNTMAVSDFTSGGTVVDLFVVPADTLIVGMSIHVSTAFNGTGVRTLTLGDSDGVARLANLAASDLAAGGYNSPIGVYKYTNQGLIQAVPTKDSNCTAGALSIYIEYIPKASLL